MNRHVGKGVFFNELLDVDWKHTSPNLGLDTRARVKVVPAGASPAGAG